MARVHLIEDDDVDVLAHGDNLLGALLQDVLDPAVPLEGVGLWNAQLANPQVMRAGLGQASAGRRSTGCGSSMA